MWAASVIFMNLPKENNHPLGENSPNLVTLLVAVFMTLKHRPQVHKFLFFFFC
jgi:hypothetical protein